MDLSVPAPAAVLSDHTVTVLLIDDQAMVGEAVRRMLADEKEIDFHYVQDPTQAIDQALAIRPTVILQDLVMPEIDGLTLVKFFRANAQLREVPLIVLSTKEEPAVKAEAFALGANDYLVKLPDKIELIARIRHHSRGYINLLERNEAYRALLESQQLLAAELAQAAEYVRSLLPPPLAGPLTAQWRFIPSTSLGGDAFGYHWLDDDHFSMYLLDVCGHGVGSALLSISVMNVLRSQRLSDVDMRRPAEVLRALNDSFQMEEHNGLYFTMWYAVFNQPSRRLAYATGGHPPAVLLTGGSAETARRVELKTKGFIVGGMPDVPFESDEIELEPYSRLFFFSDGVYEVFNPAGAMLPYETFLEELVKPAPPTVSAIDRILRFVQDYQGSNALEDDFSMVEILF